MTPVCCGHFKREGICETSLKSANHGLNTQPFDSLHAHSTTIIPGMSVLILLPTLNVRVNLGKHSANLSQIARERSSTMTYGAMKTLYEFK